MRAIRAIAGTAALVMALMGTSATGAAAGGDKAKGYIETSDGTLSFHASEPGKGGFEWIRPDGSILVGKVTCYIQGEPTATGTTATMVGEGTKGDPGPVTFFLKDGPGPTDEGDGFGYAGRIELCTDFGDFSSERLFGYVDMRP